MSVNRIERKLKNVSDRGRRYTDMRPSMTSLTEGEEVISNVNGIVTMYRKQNGKLYKINYSSNGKIILDEQLVDIRNNLNVHNDLTVDGEIKGQRSIFQFGEATSTSADAYLTTINGVVMASGKGFTMHRPGSIVGISILANITTADSDNALTFEIRKNTSSTVLFSTTYTGSSTGLRTSYSTQNRGVDIFSAGDILVVYANEAGTWVWDDVIGHIEVVFDS